MILSFTPEQAERDIWQLAHLLIDAVDSGASVGFMPPLPEQEAIDYWRGVIAVMRKGARILLVSMDGDLIQGSVQIDLETRANGNHRAEAIKLFVHRRARRQGTRVCRTRPRVEHRVRPDICAVRDCSAWLSLCSYSSLFTTSRRR